MLTDENKLLVRRFIDEVINTGHVERIEEFISPDYVEVHDGIRHPVGIEGAKGHIHGVRQTFHDLHLTIERQLADGEWVATCITAHGIHKSSWLGTAPTGKEVTFTGVNINRVVDGKIVEHGGAANLYGPLLNIGALRVVTAGD